MRLAAGGSAIRCFACRKAVTIPIQGFPINFGLRDAVATLTKVQQLSESTLRCSKCRAPCDQTEIWICVECNREAITSILIDDDISDIEETEKSTCLCASCSLRFHFKHELVEFSRLRQRRNKVFELRKQKMHDIDEMLDDLSRSFLKKLRPCLIKPLKDEFDAKLSDLSCSVDHSIEEIDQISTKLIEEFAERLRNIEQNIDVQFKMLMLPCGIRESRYERPTQL
ncbi:hypothetical protein AB6A40_008341 [Gnathostoma spinigerum]|uniref:Uncharacterized protein n=1 Tax=Gnathostoma spinigerum TaxID=75299 RepID=A0ABD6EY62_9BILA